MESCRLPVIFCRATTNFLLDENFQFVFTTHRMMGSHLMGNLISKELQALVKDSRTHTKIGARLYDKRCIATNLKFNISNFKFTITFSKSYSDNESWHDITALALYLFLAIKYKQAINNIQNCFFAFHNFTSQYHF